MIMISTRHLEAQEDGHCHGFETLIADSENISGL